MRKRARQFVHWLYKRCFGNGQAYWGIIPWAVADALVALERRLA